MKKKSSDQKKKKEINPDDSILKVLQKYPQTLQVFQKFGLSCFACPFAQFESIKQLTEIEKIDLDYLLEELNSFIEEEKD